MFCVDNMLSGTIPDDDIIVGPLLKPECPESLCLRGIYF